ncbi:MAG TPA: L-seryl-tRNA(Sec) selenium transferase [Bordetella sp.]
MTAQAATPSAAVLAAPADIPALDRVLAAAPAQALLDTYGRTRVVAALREHMAALRAEALAGGLPAARVQPDAIAGEAGEALRRAAQSRLRAVYNLTGTVLHTNLGRALLPDEAVQAVMHAMTAPANLEFDLESGGRGDRDDLIESLLRELTGAEAATVVNNNAAAVLLMLNALADRREVVVSRGELVEIGGAFRIPDIMKRAGAKLVEVGTTNRTHAADYDTAIGPRTAMLMKVHCSNYAVSGFTKSVDVAEVAKIAHARGLPMTVDLGSGTLIDLAQWGLPREDTVRDTVQAGADLVTFSGDKLLGGPQAGLLVGNADLIRKIKKNPLKRALRVGKLTLAALEPVLALYRSPEFLAERLTTLRLLTRAQRLMQAAAERLRDTVQHAVGADYQVEVAAMFSQIGSGALPVDQLPSCGLCIRHAGPGRAGRHLARLEAGLRGLPRPVIGRLGDDALWLDLRCLEERDEAGFVAQLDRYKK